MLDKFLKIGLPVIAVILIVVALAAPIGPMPGFFIGGNPAPLPENWDGTESMHEVKLRVATGALPRVVIIWFVEVNGDLHVVGSADSGWVTMIGDGAPVQLRMGDSTYDMTATRVTEGLTDVLEPYVAKYQADYPDIVAGFPSVQEATTAFGVFRLQ